MIKFILLKSKKEIKCIIYNYKFMDKLVYPTLSYDGHCHKHGYASNDHWVILIFKKFLLWLHLFLIR